MVRFVAALRRDPIKHGSSFAAKLTVTQRSSAVAMAGWLLVSASCGDRSPSSPTESGASGRPPVMLKVMTFNIQHGIDGSSSYNLQSAIDTIARAQPDVVGLQEVTRNHPYYACDDQPVRLAAGLRAATGQLWEVTYEQEWFTPDVSCQQTGRGDGRETEGLAFLTRRTMSQKSMLPLPDSRIALQIALRDGYGLPLVVTHLSSGGANAAARTQQIDRLVAWARRFGQPLVVMGDFNAAPQAPELQPVITSFRDAWADAVATGKTVGGGPIQRSTRVDYIFYIDGGSMRLDSAEFVDTATLIGKIASDHQPFVATFTLR
jgi:endonuclease/exonuclease/phosphatase family metal-dependent hydrolase